jgi:hypothetical protein
MADPGLGGKGRKAPYDSTLVRVPLPLKPLVVSLIYAWRNRLGGIIDPKGQKLVSQVESAVATASPENIPVKKLNLAAGDVNKLHSALELITSLQQSNAQLRSQLEAAERLIGRRLLEMAQREEQTQKKQELAISKLAEENSSLRHQLDELAIAASAWACRAQDAEARLERLSEHQSDYEALEAE